MSRRQGAEAGQVTAFVTVVTMALVLATGLVVDGGRLIEAKRRVNNRAERAARAGARALSIEALRSTGNQVIDEGRARTAVRGFLGQVGSEGNVVSVTDDSVTVEVTAPTSLLILGVAGLADQTVTGTGTARNVRGVTAAES